MKIEFHSAFRAPRSALVLALVSVFSLQPSALVYAAPLGTAFTYQGRLNDGSNPATGIYDLNFSLFGVANGDSPLSGPITNTAVAITNGIFTVTLDFGEGVFTGDARWLEIAVRTNGATSFVTLLARQSITPTPYALHARSVSVPLSLIGEGAPGTALLSVGSTGAGVAIGASSQIGDIAVLGKNNTAVWGISPSGFAGYFDGKGYFSGNVGIGTSNPQGALQVNGTVMADNFSGSGAGLTGISLSAMPPGIVTNQQSGITLQGTFNAVSGLVIENRTSDPPSPAVGQIWLRTDF